ncbi:MAG: hypothetical protein SH850_23660 [Planctomycetaceae bacterium]|nr:hypothetical protein [Planctomycetaceae bacterium]
MATFHRKRWRAALRIAAALETNRAAATQVDLPQGAWDHLVRLAHQHQLALDNHWFQAAESLRQDLEIRVRWFETDLFALRRSLSAKAPEPPALRTLYEELCALDDEFEDVEIDLKTTTLRVQTSDIVLEDLNLGPFDLIWDWGRPSSQTALTVDALEPHRPESRSDITHPHVLGSILCEGEASRPLEQALAEGRLCDYFLIVRQTLQTYNPQSAYVAIADWTGFRCRGCDDSVSADDLCSCQSCGDEACTDCSLSCAQCGRTSCRCCLQNCSDCLDDFCPRCWPDDVRPRESVCSNCRVAAEATPEENTADETNELENAADGTAAPSSDADDPVHADRLGEAALAAGPG